MLTVIDNAGRHHEIVQCQDCRWYYRYYCRYHQEELGILLAKASDEYCSDGEKGKYE